MTTQQQLYGRALRILSDGRQHSADALRWARCMVQRQRRLNTRALERAGFTLAEISLGAADVVRG